MYALILFFVLCAFVHLKADTYQVFIMHDQMLRVKQINGPDGIALAAGNSLLVKKGDKVQLIVENSFSPGWIYSQKTEISNYKPDMAALKALQALQKLLPGIAVKSDQVNAQTIGADITEYMLLRDNMRIYAADIQELEKEIQSKKSKIQSIRIKKNLNKSDKNRFWQLNNQIGYLRQNLGIAQLQLNKLSDSAAAYKAMIVNRFTNNFMQLLQQQKQILEQSTMQYEMQKNNGDKGLTLQYKVAVKTQVNNALYHIALQENYLQKLIDAEPTASVWNYASMVNGLIQKDLEQWLAFTSSLPEQIQYEYSAEQDQYDITLMAVNRNDTTQKHILDFVIRTEFSRPLITFNPMLAFLLLNSAQTINTVQDANGNIVSNDTSAHTLFLPRPGSALTLWLARLDKRNGIDVGIGAYLGYAHNAVFDVGPQITLAWRNYFGLSLSYISASLPNKTLQINGNSEKSILSYQRQGSLLLGLTIGQLP
jgi:hypothetical protein